MRLESALRTSQEGITAHGQAIAVIGDNISNASTTAFKEQRAEFDDLLSQRQNDKNSEVVAGVGNGVEVARVRLNFENGPINDTGRDLDLALTGNGFFLVGDPAAPKLTRVGTFQVSSDGFLTTSNGLQVLGYSGSDTTTLGPIRLDQLDTKAQPTGLIEIFGNLDAAARLSNPPANPVDFRALSNEASFVSTHNVFDATGVRHDVQVYYFKTATNQWTAQAYVNGSDVGQAANQPVLLGQTNLQFNELGQINDAERAQVVINMNPTWANGAGGTPVTISLGSFSQFAGGPRVTNTRQDGRGNGDVLGFQVEPDGKVFGILNTGDRVQAGTLAVGTVPNRDGLERQGDSVFAVTSDSGALAIGTAQVGGRGGVQGQALEGSNVDLSGQFVDMIVYQRGYQASSQVFSTASDLLKNTIALIR
jgi:flagellar hook protein FlgE